MTHRPETNPLAAAVVDHMARALGDGSAPRVFFAPGRVNLVGAHLDYNGGQVLPTAVDRGVYLAMRPRSDDLIRLRSLDRVAVVDTRAEEVGVTARREHDWANYPLGVWREFRERTGAGGGLDLAFGGDLPIASGLSSSAAIEVVTAVALDAVYGTGLSRSELALLCHRAETRFIGLQCGIMDQFASALGRQGMVLLLDCARVEFEHVPLDPRAVEILVMDTGVPRELAGSGYNQRVAECAAAVSALAAVRARGHLAHYTDAELRAGWERLGEVERKRARHVVSESERVTAAVAGLRAGDLSVVGRAVDESHRSARDLYEVSCPELDVITAAAREHPATFGSRLTGAGFGGCAIALVRPGAAEGVTEHVQARFAAEFDRTPAVYRLQGGAEPGELSPGAAGGRSGP